MARSRLVIAILVVASLHLAAAAGEATWDYENPDKDWPSINVECAGQRQSPIDIVDTNTIQIDAFFRQYQSRLASFQLNATNNGHSVEIDLTPRQLFLSGSLFPDLYQAISVHWHMPSEHRIDGVHYAAEMHVVYQPVDRTFWTDGRPPLLVTAFMLDELDDTTIPPAELAAWQKLHNDSLLNEIVSQMGVLSNIGQTAKVKFVPRMPFMDTFYVYEGSLTTPPCRETVMWWLSPVPVKVPMRQLSDLSSLLRQEHGGEGDSRPVQPLNGRVVRKVKTFAAQVAASCRATYNDTAVQTGGSGSTCSGSSAGSGSGTTMNFFFGEQGNN